VAAGFQEPQSTSQEKLPGKKTCPAMITSISFYGFDTRKYSCGIAVFGLFV
jgi:hypothetical protein